MGRDRFILVGFTCCFVDMTARAVMARRNERNYEHRLSARAAPR